MVPRVVVATVLLLATALAGCADADYLGVDAHVQDDDVQDGNATATPDNGTAAPNGTADANATADPNATAQPASAGTLIITTVANATAGEPFDARLDFYHPGNEPRPSANGTNGTGHPGTPAYHDDVFWAIEVQLGNQSLLLNGTSVPATVPLVLNQTGNATIYANLTWQEKVAVAQPVVVAVQGAVVAVQCSAQATKTISGNYPGAVLYNGFTTTVRFDVEPCQKSVTVDLDTTGSGVDIDLFLDDPAGQQVASGESAARFTESVTYSAAELPPGSWAVRIRGYASGPALYELNVSFAA